MGVDSATDLNSPDGSDLDLDGQADAPVDDGAESSPALDGEPESLLDVIRDAAPDEPEDDSDPASPADEPSEAQPEEGEATEPSPKQADDSDEFAGVPFNNHPRFQKLVRERNALREPAQQYENVQNFLRDNGISGEEAAQALQIQGLLKTDKTAAWAALKPIVQQLLVDTGEVLPPDLRSQVQAGALSREHAIELSRARAAQAAVPVQRQHQEQVQAERQAAERQRSMQTAAAEWEMGKRRSDAEFDARAEAVRKEVLWLQHSRGAPQNAAEVRALLDDAYRAVAKPPAAPRRPATAPLTGGRTAGNTTPAAPKSMLDIVNGSIG